ncbi:MAG: TonB-dependent receptor [Cytophagales bacterium]|nr:MAG: TonB-dependent receptor [Cytophagales bacterium]
MKKLSLFIVLLCFGTSWALAQTGKVSGTIIDNDGEPLVGATVIIKGTTVGTITDADGNFVIEKVRDGEYTIVASYIGYKAQEQTASVSGGSETKVNFNLENDYLNLTDVVVTGTFDPQSKLESTVSITTMDRTLIDQQAARGTGDLIDAIPGFYVESGLGEAANNVYPRGLPVGTGGLRYTALREDGLNTFEISDKVFFSSDGYTKNDLTIERVEGLRGGNAVIFSSNTPGGIINFVSKTGGQELKGDVRFTFGSQQLYRVDFNVGGPLTEDKKWRFNVGGHYRYDRGLRDFTGPANIGGQVKMNLTRLFDNNKGYIRFYAKMVDDQIAFWAPVPYQGFSSPRPISGWNDLLTGSMIPARSGDISLPDPLNPGQFRTVSLGNVVNTKYSNVGAELQYDLGDGWQIKNQMRYISGTNQVSLTQVVSNPLAGQSLTLTAPPGTTPFVFYVSPNLTSGINYSAAASRGEDIPITSLASPITDAQGIRTTGLNGNGMLIPLGLFVVNSQNTNFMNNFQITKTFGDHKLVGGAYISLYNSNEYWNFNTILTDVQSNPRLVDVQYRAGSAIAAELTRGGVFGANFQYERSFTKNGTYALFIGDEWQVTDQLTATLGFRYEVNQAVGSLQNTGRRDGRTAGVVRAGSPITVGIGGTGGLDGNATTLYDNNADIPLNSYQIYDNTYEVWGANIGLNYKFNDNFALFANGSRGTRYATSQNFLANKDQGTITGTALIGQVNTADNGGFINPVINQIALRNPIEEVLQGEIGARISQKKFGITFALFGTQLSNAPFTLQSTGANGNIQLDVLLYDVRTIGGELEAIWSPVKGLRLNTSIAVQQAQYTKYPDVTVVEVNTADRVDPATPTRIVNFSGNNVERIPPIQIDFTADYTYKKFNVYGNVRYIGERWGNRRNTFKLPAFFEVGAGASYRTGNFTLGVQGINLLNALGITEGNTRTQDNIGPNAAANNDTVNTGIFILPRSFNFTVNYSF